MNQNRRNFIGRTSLAAAAAISTTFANSMSPQPKKKNGKEAALQVGIAGYTFAKFSLEEAIAMMQRLDVRNLSVKDFHLPIDSHQEKINAVMSKFKEAGINVYAVGVIYMKTREAVDAAFSYAKKVGVNLIVGAPNYDLLDYTEQKVKEYNIKVAIHNHGPEDALYPGPQQVFDRIKNRDARMGLCLDIGHATRAKVDLEKAAQAYKNRLYDLHIKDVTLAEPEGKAIELGRGIIDFKPFVEVLEKINYPGYCSIEYEKDMSNPLPGIAESLGYFKGVVATV